jgi:hypothetical protein
VSLAPAHSAARPSIPTYLAYCIRQALFRSEEPVMTRLSFLVACASAGLGASSTWEKVLS